MEDRTTEDYLSVLEQVKNTINIKPIKIIIDFERAERNALQTMFPDAKIIGCFFHYSQVIKDNTHNNKYVHFHYITF